MFMLWLFWLFVLFGGLFMGLAAARVLLSQFTLVALLNAIVYLGCAGYALPRVWKLLRGPAAPRAH